MVNHGVLVSFIGYEIKNWLREDLGMDYSPFNNNSYFKTVDALGVLLENEAQVWNLAGALQMHFQKVARVDFNVLKICG